MEGLLAFLGLPFSEEVLVSARPQTNKNGELG
jgi:hypothetical protein